MKTFLNQYYNLRSKIDSELEKLYQIDENQLNCKKNCSKCCEEFKIFPIEFFAIKNEIENVKYEKSVNSCKFLKDNQCQIYHSRPIICRTQGFPLLFMSEDYNYEISICELNFVNFDFQNFSKENTFPLDTFNSKLFILNKSYIEISNLNYSEFDLLTLNDL